MDDSLFLKVDLSSYFIEDSLIKEVPQHLVTQYQFMPVFKIGKTLTIATSEPDNLSMHDEIRDALACEIDMLYSSPEDIRVAINQHYGFLDSIDSLVTAVNTSDTNIDINTPTNWSDIAAEDVAKYPIIQLVNAIINQAIISHASDIHIEPGEKNVSIRTRVDGALHVMRSFSSLLLPAMVSRIKVMAEMDIAESRKPQDGQCRLTHEGKNYELRISSLPTIYGENVVIRILSRDHIQIDMQELGFSKSDMETFKKLLKHPQGMLLVTGPTGSGKTTTLYAALNHINTETRNIVTLEDPVENKLPLIRQVQVNEKAGLTFSSGLRSILRQDPDVIMVGEIRDLETGELATRASLTGHMVLSTLHTNDAPSTIMRLLDMGIPSYVISSSITAIIAQRLVRKTCQRCQVEYEPDPIALSFLGLSKDKTYYKGKGCKSCMQTGFKGRIGIYEVLVLSSFLKERISIDVSASEFRRLALEDSMSSLNQDGVKKIQANLTTAEEIFKAIQFLTD